MEKKTAEEIVKVLENNCKTEDFGENWGDLSELGLGECFVVHTEGNETGGGEYSETVRYFKDHDIYIRIQGKYYSYHGVLWRNEYQVVRPKEKTITVYEA